MIILAQFPTFARPDKFLNCFQKYLLGVSGQNKIIFNINCDTGDGFMFNETMQKAVMSLPTRYHVDDVVTVRMNYDHDTTKISSINSHIDDLFFDIVICLSDDMIPQQDGWDLQISSDMQEYFPNLNGCLHYNDGYQQNKLITLSILGKRLYEYFGYIYHPDYKSLYCDNEFTQEVYKLGRVQYIDKVIIKHEHYGEADNSNSGDLDLSAKKTLYFSGRDQLVFEERQRRNFPKERITID